jgi:hypothetical protein
MAQSGVVVSEMASASGHLPSTVDRILRDLRAAGMAPTGQPGRGETYGQFGADHLANLLLAFAALQPSGSANAVRALNQLRHEWTDDEHPGGSLVGTLESEIERRALLIRDGGKVAQELLLPQHGFELTLCLDPIEAWTTLPLDDGSVNRQRWLPVTGAPSGPPRGIRRLTILSVDVMNRAARLCADTIGHRPLSIPTALDAETENAALPGAAPTQDHVAIPVSNKRKRREKRKHSQPYSGRAPGISSSQPRNRIYESPLIRPVS